MWLGRVFCVLVIICAHGQAEDADSWTVTIEQGAIRGYQDPARGLFVFYNIPYATAPTGKNRFKFSFPSENKLPEGVRVKVEGANHCAQTMTVLDGFGLAGKSAEKDIPGDVKEIKKITRQFWLNFMTTGKPVPEGSDLPAWPAADGRCSPYMDIALPAKLRGPLLPERTRFWEEVYARYYRPPTAPPKPPQKHIEL